MNMPKLRFKNDDGGDFTDWEEKKINEIAQIVGGGTPDTSVTSYWQGSINWFTPTEIKSKYASGSLRTITKEGLKNSSAKVLPIGTLLFSSRATVGDVSIALRECTTNQGFQSFIVNNKNSNEFIYYWILNNKRAFLKKASGSTFLEISKREIDKLIVLCPSLPEQTKIANFFSAVDEKITQLTQKQELLSKYKKGVMQKIFTQELRFKDDDGSEFPDLVETTLGETGKFKSGTGFSDSEQGGTSGIPFFKVSDMNLPDNKLEMLVANNYVSEEQIKKLKYRVIFDEAIVFAKVGAAIYLERKRKAKNFLIDNNMMAFIPNCQINFIKHFMDSIRLSKFAQVGALPSYNASDLSIIKLSMPCIKEQTKIANFLTAIDEKITATQSQLELVKQYKQGLLQQMFI